MEFKVFFSTLKNRISNGYDVPEFFRDLFAMITDVSEENWGTQLDPATKKTKDASLRSYAKRGIPKKFAQQIVYSLSPENYIESLNSRPAETRKLLADDFLSYDAEVTDTKFQLKHLIIQSLPEMDWIVSAERLHIVSHSRSTTLLKEGNV